VVGGGVPNAFRWTQASGTQFIGTLPGHARSMATAVSDDGSIVVGISSSGFLLDRLGPGGSIRFEPQFSRAFYWTEAGGIQDLNILLANAGTDMTGLKIAAALGLSRDGAWIGGALVTSESESNEFHPFIASLTASLSTPGDFNDDGAVNEADLAQWTANFGATSGASRGQGDADGDADVDGNDFLTWQRQLDGSPAAEATAAVPEPRTATLLMLTAALRVRRRLLVAESSMPGRRRKTSQP
jgi:hypothetical protein